MIPVSLAANVLEVLFSVYKWAVPVVCYYCCGHQEALIENDYRQDNAENDPGKPHSFAGSALPYTHLHIEISVCHY